MSATRTFECLSCSGSLEFAAGRVSTWCRICEAERPLPVRIVATVPELAVEGPAPAPESLTGRALAQCSVCQAVLSAPAEVGTCPQCEAPAVPLTSAPTVLPAQGQLPFLIDAEAAEAAVRRLARRPEGGAIPRLRRAYVPWLVMSCAVKGEYHGRRGERHEDYQDSGHRRSYTEWFPVSGFIDRKWEYRRKCSSPGIVASVQQRLEPWDWAFVEPYDLQALGDGVVEHCTNTPTEIVDRILPDFMFELTNEARYGIGGDLQEVQRVEGRRFDARVRVVMMPVWIGRPGPDRAVIVHGRTGAVLLHGYKAEPPGGSAEALVWIAIVAIAVLVVGAILWALV